LPACARPGAAAAATSDFITHRRHLMRSLLLFFLGVPIPIIILIALFFH
jgi:hypothetical protein